MSSQNAALPPPATTVSPYVPTIPTAAPFLVVDPSRQQPPPLPSRLQAGDPGYRAIVVFDVGGHIQHRVLPLHRHTPSPVLSAQLDTFRGVWTTNPLRCPICCASIVTATAPGETHAFSIIKACNHTPDKNHGGSESDSSLDDDDNLNKNIAISQVFDFSSHSYRGNVAILKHSVVPDLPRRLMDVGLLDVHAEDFEFIYGLVRRFLVGDWPLDCGPFLPSPWTFRRLPVSEWQALLRAASI
ncbi:hypothetical protein C8F01DRAFT_1299013 [Mycena amicta]|nr:hypothetical protein C8F01DRAFT_1299013 [Mycena amicta]